MKTIRTKVYQFSELSDSAKKTAIQWFLNSFDDSYAWDDIQEDANQIGLKIISIDDHRPNKGEFITSAYEVSCKIVQEHGANCDTHKTAVQFGKDWAALVEKYNDGITLDKVSEDNEYDFDQDADELESEFMQSLLEDYRIMYNNQVEYEYSDEFAKETIEANEYDFTKDGKRFNK